ncbi:MAG TPA: type II 3-dehydroquinate dehydratase [Chloroflexota bacterium]|jgi:3-dehydroquinate dehydratase-2
MKILVLHGPNLNLFGRRETSIYGTTTFADINRAIEEQARELGVDVEIFQSNHEGALLDKLHQRIDDCDGCVINPGALSHYSIALHDCLKAMPFPTVEVHLSNVARREPFRHQSFVSPVAEGTIAGLGWRGYLLALRWLVEARRPGT